MEPTTLTAAAIATLIVTKAFEKIGERFGEEVLEQANRLLAVLTKKKPKVAEEIKRIREQPLNLGQAHLIDETEQPAKLNPQIAQVIEVQTPLINAIEAAAKTDSEVAAVVNAVRVAVEQENPKFSTAVIQEMAIGIQTDGKLEAGDMEQTTEQTSGDVRQRMGIDWKIQGDIKLGNLTQRKQ